MSQPFYLLNSNLLLPFFPPSASVPRHSPFRLGRRRVRLRTSKSSDPLTFSTSHLLSVSCPLPSDFRIFSRGIVPPYRTTTGPTSEFHPSVLSPLRYAIMPSLKRSAPQVERSLNAVLHLSTPIFSLSALSPQPSLLRPQFRPSTNSAISPCVEFHWFLRICGII
jgi:hypothetical protein